MQLTEPTDEEIAAYERNLNREPLFRPDHSEDQDYLYDESDAAKALVTIIARTPEAQAFLKHQIDIDSHAWGRLCQKLQRSARNAPALAASAFISANMTPKQFRVDGFDNAKRGMIGYSWNPDNPGSGHVFDILGRTKNGVILTTTNDAFEFGAVDVVPITFYHDHWAHELQFPATWINGFEFPDFHTHVQPVKDKPSLGKSFDESIAHLKDAYNFHHDKGHTRLANQLDRQLQHMKMLNKRWK